MTMEIVNINLNINPSKLILCSDCKNLGKFRCILLIVCCVYDCNKYAHVCSLFSVFVTLMNARCLISSDIHILGALLRRYAMRVHMHDAVVRELNSMS